MEQTILLPSLHRVVDHTLQFWLHSMNSKNRMGFSLAYSSKIELFAYVSQNHMNLTVNTTHGKVTQRHTAVAGNR